LDTLHVIFGEAIGDLAMEHDLGDLRDDGVDGAKKIHIHGVVLAQHKELQFKRRTMFS
jgi:hypothetical protein